MIWNITAYHSRVSTCEPVAAVAFWNWLETANAGFMLLPEVLKGGQGETLKHEQTGTVPCCHNMPRLWFWSHFRLIKMSARSKIAFNCRWRPRWRCNCMKLYYMVQTDIHWHPFIFLRFLFLSWTIDIAWQQFDDLIVHGRRIKMPEWKIEKAIRQYGESKGKPDCFLGWFQKVLWLHVIAHGCFGFCSPYGTICWFKMMHTILMQYCRADSLVSWGINRFSLVKNEVDWGELRLFERSWLGLMWFQEISWAIKSSCHVVCLDYLVLELEGIGILRMAPESFQAWTNREPMQPRKVWCLRPQRLDLLKHSWNSADLCQLCHCFGTSIIRHHQSPALLQEEYAAAQQAAVVPAAGPGEAKSLFKFHDMSVLAQYGLYNTA